MADQISQENIMESTRLRIGGVDLSLKKSATQIAVRPRTGGLVALEKELNALSFKRLTKRLPSVGSFEIVEFEADESRITAERANIRQNEAVGYEVPVYHTSDDQVPFVPVGTIYLEFTANVPDQKRQEIIDKYELQLVEAEPNGALTVRVGNVEEDAVSVSAKLQSEEAVDIAEPDLATPGALRALDMPDDRLLNRQWHLKNLGNHGGESVGYKEGADARVVEAWEVMGSLGDPNVVIGIIDDGFDLSHPDLSEKSIHPWDFTRQTSDVSPEPNLHSQRLGDWHGTACAGVATASVGQGDVVGAAPLARLIPVRWGPDLEPRGVAKWFDHMTANGAWVLSCSWGAAAKVFPLHARIKRAIARCARNGRAGKGTVILFAAGNSNHDIDDLPNSFDGFANHPDVVAIAASTSMDNRAHYSNFGHAISVCAPSSGNGGWGIVTADVRGTYEDANGNVRPLGYSDGDYDFSFGGTSSACPLVAGVFALVLGANPSLSALDAIEVVQKTARKIGDPNEYGSEGHSREFGHGCVDASAAVIEALRIRAESPLT